MTSTGLLIAYCACILLGSLAGGWIPLAIRLTHTRLQTAISFIGGAMLGVALLHLLPHACFELHNVIAAASWMLGGFLLMFFIERVFHFHHHDSPSDDGHAHSHAHDHVHGPGCDHGHDSPAAPKMGWGAALAGLSLHSTLDGLALAAAVASETRADPDARWAGLAVFLVILLHKPFDSLTLGALMALAGKPPRMRHAVNLLYALAIPLGVAIFHLTAGAGVAAEHSFIGAALAFAAGCFLCISTSDLLPELQFHSHDRFRLSAALLLGVVLSAVLVYWEEQQHAHGQAPVHEHEHEHEEE